MHLRRGAGPVFALALASALAGCALDPPPTTEELQQQALPHTQVPAHWKAGRDLGTPIAEPWLASFKDPALVSLVDEALAFNADLQRAAARVEEAGGLVKVASGALLPTVRLAGIESGKSGGDGGLNGVFLNASLELDVWGRLRYGQAAAEAQSAAADADFAYARQSLAAMVAKSWFLAIEAGLQQTISEGALGSAQQLLRLSQDRLRIGVGDEQAVAEARANVGTFRDTLRQTMLAREQAVRALELLLGRYPAAELSVAHNFGPAPDAVTTGVPSELLERRPDVIAAERRVAAAFNRIGEAKAARLPRISISAGASSISSDVFVLKDTDNPAFSLGANLLAPIYMGGVLQAQVEIRTAEQKEAVADYARIAQRSFGEVESALATEDALHDRDAILSTNITDLARSLELTQVQYRVGKVDLRSVSQQQLALYAAQASRVRVQGEALAQRVNLYLALGGSFDTITTEPVAAK